MLLLLSDCWLPSCCLLLLFLGGFMVVMHSGEKKPEELDLPKYRDRAKERREDQNPDYEPSDLGLHVVAPPGSADIVSAESHKLAIERSKYLGGDVEQTHLVKGLDYALLQKVKSEMDKKPGAEGDTDGKPREYLCYGLFLKFIFAIRRRFLYTKELLRTTSLSRFVQLQQSLFING